MDQKIGSAFIKNFILNLANVVILQKGYLDDLDAACGDGDFGVGMYIGFENVKKAIEQKDEEDLGHIFDEAGHAILSSVGGASGVLFGTLFIEAGKVAGTKREIDLNDLSNMMRASLEKICRRGGSKQGDKTLIDALWPAVESLEDAAKRNLDLTEALLMTANAARRGAESTKDLIAKQGKARYLGEQTLGHVDPGAELIRLIFETLFATYKSTGGTS